MRQLQKAPRSNTRQVLGDLTDGLRSGEPQNEVKHTTTPMLVELYKDPHRLQQFMNAMAGVSMSGFRSLAETFDFPAHQTLCDFGGATGLLSVIVAGRHPHMRCITFDLPMVEPLAQQTIAAAGLIDRVHTAACDFLVDTLPKADIITMSMILYDWNLPKKCTSSKPHTTPYHPTAPSSASSRSSTTPKGVHRKRRFRSPPAPVCAWGRPTTGPVMRDPRWLLVRCSAPMASMLGTESGETPASTCRSSDAKRTS